jgi:hypothetical protein
MKAHVRNGHFVVDEPTELPEGTEVEIVLTRVVDPFANMDPSERVELEQAIEEGYEDFERGDYEDAKEFAARLLAKP